MAKTNGKIEYQIRRGLKNRAVFTVDSAAVGPGQRTLIEQRESWRLGRRSTFS
jgi:hypothetical protein